MLSSAAYAMPGLKYPISAREHLLMSGEDVMETVLKHFNVTFAQVCSKSRLRYVCYPRQVVMYFLREYTNLSTTEIGQVFGGRDHTTAIHSCNTIRDLIKSTPRVADDVATIKIRLLK